MLQILKQHPLLPTANGTFARATEVKLARGRELRDLINNQQLADLYGVISPLYWLSSEITVNRVRDLYHYLTECLEVDVVDPDLCGKTRTVISGETNGCMDYKTLSIFE